MSELLPENLRDRCSSKTEAEERLTSYLAQREYEVVETHILEFEGATGNWDNSIVSELGAEDND
jgi:ATP phosphoribosyltransferase regulatory subunit HisZ